MAKQDGEKPLVDLSQTQNMDDLVSETDVRDPALARTVGIGDTSMPSSSGQPIESLPQKLGDYEILGEIARGGMGVVYRARQISLNRIVALKMVLAGNLAGEEAIQRFYAEAEAAAKLDHPGIVPIFEVGEIDGNHFYSMGFVDGPSLKQRIADGPLPPREAAELVQSIATAVSFAHDHGIIHRDLKPANVIFDQKGNPRVTDFGLAKQVEGDTDLTVTGQVLGTPMYMPPEQAEGKTDEIGPASDVYSLGAVLYELLVGHPPFQAASPMVILRMVMEKEPTPPSQLNPAVDRDLETICLKCMQKEASARYETPTEIADELGRFLAGEPIQARPIGSIQRVARWCRRKPVTGGLIATGLLLLLALGIGGPIIAIQQGKLDQQLSTNAEQQQAIVQQREQAVADREEFATEREKLSDEKEELADLAQEEATRAIHAAYGSSMTLAFEAFRADDFDRVRELLDRLRPSQESELDIRGFGWHFLDRAIRLATDPSTDQELVSEIKTDGGHGQTLAFSPDGKWLVAPGAKELIRVWSMESQPPEVAHELPGISLLLEPGARQIGPDAHLRAVAFSKDSTLLATACGSEFIKGPLCIWNVETGEELIRITNHTASIHDMVFSHDGSTLVTVDGAAPVQGNICFWSVEDGALLRSHPGKINEIRSVDLSPDGRMLAIGGGWGDDRGEARLINFDDGELIRTLDSPSKVVGDIEFSPDGRRVLTAEGFWFGVGGLTVWDVDNGQPIQSLQGHAASLYSATYTPDGLRIAAAGRDNKTHLWDAVTGDYLLAIEAAVPIYEIDFSPTEHQLVAVGQNPAMPSKVYSWQGSASGDPVILRGHRDYVLGTGFIGPEGDILPKVVSMGKDKQTIVWDLAKGGFPVESHKVSSPIPVGLHAARDGTRFFTIETVVANQLPTISIVCRDGTTFEELDSMVAREPPMAFGASEDGQRYAIASIPTPTVRLKVYELPGFVRLLDIPIRQGVISSLSFSPDGKRLAVGKVSSEALRSSLASIYDCSTGEITFEQAFKDRVIRQVAFSPDGQKLLITHSEPPKSLQQASSAPPTVHVYETKSGKLEHECNPPFADSYSCWWSRHGILLVASDSTCALWSLESENFLWKLDGNLTQHENAASFVPAFALSPQEQFLTISRADCSIEVLNLKTGQPLMVQTSQAQ